MSSGILSNKQLANYLKETKNTFSSQLKIKFPKTDRNHSILNKYKDPEMSFQELATSSDCVSGSPHTVPPNNSNR